MCVCVCVMVCVIVLSIHSGRFISYAEKQDPGPDYSLISDRGSDNSSCCINIFVVFISQDFVFMMLVFKI